MVTVATSKASSFKKTAERSKLISVKSMNFANSKKSVKRLSIY